jgi:hypothetical protein
MQEEDREWQEWALCSTLSPSLFFEEYEEDPDIRDTVRSICFACPVRDICYDQGSRGEVGVWGGVYWNGKGEEEEFNP